MSTSIHLARIPGRIDWRLSQRDPTAFRLRAFPKWEILTPLHPESARLQEHADVEYMGRLRGHALLSSGGICLRRTGALRRTAYMHGLPAGRILARLRYVSKQFSIPRNFVSISCHIITTPASSSPRVSELHDCSGMKILVRDYYTRTVVTAKHLSAVANLPRAFEIPPHSEILLDALDAHVNSDYRKALLYAAIAVESYARSQLEAWACALRRRQSPLHRQTKARLAGGKTVRKDPVYDALCAGDNFGRLLHELPLYLEHRSLLVDDADLYRRARQLYTTRNKLVHIGALPDDPQLIPLTRTGSSLGLRTAIQVLEWFGDCGPYTAWDGFVDLVTGEPDALVTLGAG